tara:strand:+ start:36 stop:212 length:177 start_codon:yes stop_codon:yes gene_type:complete
MVGCQKANGGKDAMSWKDNLKKQDVGDLEKIVEELGKAVEMHKSQAERIKQFIKKIKG